MNFKEDFKINEFDKLNINKKKLIQNKGQKINLFLIINIKFNNITSNHYYIFFIL